jgi:hypothetical protein
MGGRTALVCGRRPALKVKHRLTLRVQVPGGSLAPSNGVIGAGAARVQLAYTHPCTDALATIEELVRVS